MRFLVTGGAGFIGSHVVNRLLGDGHHVTVIDNFSTGRQENLAYQGKNKHLRLVEEDISVLDSVKEYFQGIEVVIHLAALADIVPSITDPGKYYNSNVTGTFSVVEASRFAGVKRLIYSASSSCYGIPDAYPTSEASEIRPQYPYALTKYLGEQIVLHWSRVYKLPAVSLRLFNVYGPRSRTSGAYGAVFGVLLAQKLKGIPFTVVGDGNQTRDFVHVSDVVEAFIAAALSEIETEVFNVGSGKPQSINKLVFLMGGKKIHIPKRPGEPDCTWADISKVKRMFGWQPKVSFEEGVQKMLEQIDYWRDAPVWTPATIEKATDEWFKCLGKGSDG